jgi:hypothetical protein
MVFAYLLLRTGRSRGRCSIRQRFGGWLALSVLFVASPTRAEPKKDDAPELPRLGLDPGEPQVRSAPPAIPFGIPPATSKEYVFDFHGYMLLPLRMGIAERENPAEGQSKTVLHTPPLIPQNYRRFEYTAVVPDPWVQLNFTYGNNIVAGTAILAATTVTDADAVYDPVQQLGVSSAYLTFNLKEAMGTPFQGRVGAMSNRYGAMGAFDSGRYATPLIARVNAIGETITAGFEFGKTMLVLEQGIGGQLGRTAAGLMPSAWNDFADPDAGASFVGHFHAGLAVGDLLQFGAHYIHAWSQDDQNLDTALANGRIAVMGADARLTAGRYGHLYLGAARTDAANSQVVSGIIEILNARGGPGLMSEYLGPGSNGDGALMTFGAQYDMSLSRMVFGEEYEGKNTDVLFSLFGIGTSVTSDDPAYDGVLKLKVGAEATYNLTSWFGANGRIDHVRLDNEFNARAFNVLTGRALFHTDWLSRDEFALQYSYFLYGDQVNVAKGYPPVEDPSLTPDNHVLAMSATFWW